MGGGGQSVPAEGRGGGGVVRQYRPLAGHKGVTRRHRASPGVTGRHRSHRASLDVAWRQRGRKASPDLLGRHPASTGVVERRLVTAGVRCSRLPLDPAGRPTIWKRRRENALSTANWADWDS